MNDDEIKALLQKHGFLNCISPYYVMGQLSDFRTLIDEVSSTVQSDHRVHLGPDSLPCYCPAGVDHALGQRPDSGRVHESAEDRFEQYVETLIDKAPDVQKLGERLAHLLDDDQFNNIEPTLLGIAAALAAQGQPDSGRVADEVVEAACDMYDTRLPAGWDISAANPVAMRAALEAALAAQGQGEPWGYIGFREQAVDVGAVLSVCNELRYAAGGNHAWRVTLADRITRAIGNAQAEGWRPIETAPKDGTRVLLSNAQGVWMAEYRPVYGSGYRPDDPWFSTMLNHDHMPKEVRYAKPTHWKHIPTPPQPAQAERTPK